ncbi:MAG: hypothetical protein B7Y17_01830, partial [Sulfuricurvum sp. 24-42-5]
MINSLLKVTFRIIFLSALLLQATVLDTNQLRSGLSFHNFSTTLATMTSDKSDDDQFWYWLNLARLQQANGDFTSSIQSF